MIKHVMALALVVALSACSSDSNNDTPTGNTDANGTADSGNNGGDNGGDNGGNNGGDNGGTITPSGDIPGVWFGQNNFGEAVMVIDSNQNVYSLAANGSGGYETVFGPTSGQLDQFFHRDSIEANATSFTLAGDLPSTQGAASDTITYDLSVGNEGQQLTNAGTATAAAFDMTLAQLNDVPAISVGDVAGTWTAQTSYECVPVNCQFSLTLNIAASGALTGDTNFNNGEFVAELTGTVAAGSSQYLTINFNWNETSRAGVLYFDRADNTRLIVNTVGPNGAAKQSLSGRLTR